MSGPEFNENMLRESAKSIKPDKKWLAKERKRFLHNAEKYMRVYGDNNTNRKFFSRLTPLTRFKVSFAALAAAFLALLLLVYTPQQETQRMQANTSDSYAEMLEILKAGPEARELYASEAIARVEWKVASVFEQGLDTAQHEDSLNRAKLAYDNKDFTQAIIIADQINRSLDLFILAGDEEFKDRGTVPSIEVPDGTEVNADAEDEPVEDSDGTSIAGEDMQEEE